MPIPARPPQYQHTQLVTARGYLALRLQDSGNVYWGAAELNAYIVAALRTWQALTGSYRERGEFGTVAGQAWYDLQVVLPVEFAPTVTDIQVINDIQRHLLEPATIPWSGSAQFTLDQITQSVQRRRDQFIRDTGMVVALIDPLYPSPNTSVIQLPDSVMAVRRAAWVDSHGTYTPLFRTDEFGANNFSSLTTTPSPLPRSYSVAVTPPVSLRVYPPPLDVGGVSLVVMQSGATLDPTVGVLLGIPDDFTQYVMFGALADLLGADGTCRDPQRASYCDTRYQEGVALGRLYPSGLQVQINDQPIRVGSTADFDKFGFNWQNTTGKPTRCGFVGRNLLSLNTPPDAIYGVGVDGVRNMPVPVADGDYLQVGRESLDVILDYAQHLASFNMGGQEFQNTQAQYARFIQEAGKMNLTIKAEAFYSTALAQPSQLQNFQVPLETTS